VSAYRQHDSWRRRQADARHAQALGRFAAAREDLAELFDIDLLADPAPPRAEVFEPVRGERFTFDVSCMVCGVISRFDRASTFPILIQRLEMARWCVGARSGWPKPGEALRDLRTWRACSDCAAEATPPPAPHHTRM
jgi:hypothetical protein